MNGKARGACCRAPSTEPQGGAFDQRRGYKDLRKLSKSCFSLLLNAS